MRGGVMRGGVMRGQLRGGFEGGGVVRHGDSGRLAGGVCRRCVRGAVWMRGVIVLARVGSRLQTELVADVANLRANFGAHLGAQIRRSGRDLAEELTAEVWSSAGLERPRGGRRGASGDEVGAAALEREVGFLPRRWWW
jgi:hypothetical protein